MRIHDAFSRFLLNFRKSGFFNQCLWRWRLGSKLLGGIIPIAAVLLVFSMSCFSAVQQDYASLAHEGVIRVTDDDRPSLNLTRTIKFTTNEGTAISVDVSPDGKQLVFNLLGDLYTLPVSGGTATRITSGPAIDGEPRYAPSGKHILFISDRSGAWNIWTIAVDGSGAKAVTTGHGRRYCSAVWALDSASIVAASTNGNNGRHTIARYSLKNETPVVLREHLGLAIPCTKLTGPALGPDERYLYYVQSEGRELRASISYLKRFDIFSGSTKKIVLRDGGAFRPILSRDGEWLVYVTQWINGQSGLRIKNIIRGDERWLSHKGQHLSPYMSPYMDYYPGSAFTPDNTSFVTSYDGKLWRVNVDNGSIAEIPFEAQVEQQLAPLAKFDARVPDADEVVATQLRYSQLSPDGQRLAFHAFGGIWIANASNGSSKRLTTPEVTAVEPAWSPNGKYVAYTTWDDAAGGSISRMRSDGTGRPEKLTLTPALYRNLTYSPDGRKLFFHMVPNADADSKEKVILASIPSDGGHISIVGPAAGEQDQLMTHFNGFLTSLYGRLQFADSKDRVYYLSGGSTLTGASALSSISIDGRDRREEIVGKWLDVRISPKGNRALLLSTSGHSHSMQLHLVAIPPAPRLTLDLFKFTNRVGDWAVDFDNSSLPPITLVSIAGADYIGWSKNGDEFYYTRGSNLYRYNLSVFVNGSTDYEPKVTKIVARVPASKPVGSLVFRGARVVTMKGTEVIEHADVVITGNRIAGVGETGTVHIPVGAAEINARGKTIIPGWIDLHAHAAPLGYTHRREQPATLSPLAYGVTTIRDPGIHLAISSRALSADLIKAGMRVGPRIVYALETHQDFSPEGIRSLRDVRDVISRHRELKAGLYKLYVGHRDRLMRQWIISATNEIQINSTVEGGYIFADALSMIIDGYPGIEHGMFSPTPLYEDALQMISQSGTVWTPTISIRTHKMDRLRFDFEANPKVGRFYPLSWSYVYGLIKVFRSELEDGGRHAMDAARVAMAGGRVAVGSHGEHGMRFHWELEALAQGGMSLHQVLKSGTIVGAEAIGYGRDLGSIEVGKLADLQVLNKNQLKDINDALSIQYVMKNGMLYDDETLDQLWPSYKPLGQRWWVKENPTENCSVGN